MKQLRALLAFFAMGFGLAANAQTNAPVATTPATTPAVAPAPLPEPTSATKADNTRYQNNPDLLTQQRDRVQNLLRTLNHPGASRNAARLALDLIVGRDTTMGGPL